MGLLTCATSFCLPFSLLTSLKTEIHLSRVIPASRQHKEWQFGSISTSPARGTRQEMGSVWLAVTKVPCGDKSVSPRRDRPSWFGCSCCPGVELGPTLEMERSFSLKGFHFASSPCPTLPGCPRGQGDLRNSSQCRHRPVEVG